MLHSKIILIIKSAKHIFISFPIKFTQIIRQFLHKEQTNSFFCLFCMLSVIIKNALTRISYVSMIFLCIIIHLQLHNACIWWEKWTCQRSCMNKRKCIKKVLLYDDDDGGWFVGVCMYIIIHSCWKNMKNERQNKTIECSRKKEVLS